MYPEAHTHTQINEITRLSNLKRKISTCSSICTGLLQEIIGTIGLRILWANCLGKHIWDWNRDSWAPNMQCRSTALTISFLILINGNLSMTPYSNIIFSLMGTTVSRGLFHYSLCTYAVTIHNLPLNLCFHLLI